MSKQDKESIIKNAEKRLEEMRFGYNFYSELFLKTHDNKYFVKYETLLQDYHELEKELKLFKGGE